MKIAWFSPFHRRGDIARYSAAACGGLLADGHEVVVFAPDLRDSRLGARTDIPIVGVDDFDREAVLCKRPEFDLVVFNLGANADDYREIYEFSRACPGVVVLHDLVMRPFFEVYYVRDRGGDRTGLLRLMEYCHGPDGRAWMEAMLNGRIADARSEPHALEYHMARAAVAGACGVIVHSESYRGRVAELAGAPVIRLAYPTPASEALDGDPPAAASGRPARLLSVGSVHRHSPHEAFNARRYGRDIVAFAEELRSLRPVLDLTDRVGRLVQEMTAGPGAQAVLGRVAEEIGWLADDDSATSAPHRRRAASGSGAIRAGHAA